jgi:hypothetical protein
MRLISVLFIVFCSLLPIQAQQEIDPFISESLLKGDAATLASFFNENVELVIGSTNDVFSKKQATGIVADFFRRNKVLSYQILHKGIKENSAFTIGTIRTSTGNFRVYVLVRRVVNEKQLIQQLRIETSND